LAEGEILAGMGRRRLKLPVASIALALIACQAGKEKGSKMSSILETEYWSTAADEGLPLSLTLLSTGTARLWIRSNRDNAGRGALGYFEGAIPAKSVSDVLAAIESQDFSAAPNPASVVPGEVVRKISATRLSGPALVRFVGEESPAPAGFAKAESACLQAIEDAAKFPALAIGFSRVSLPSELASGEDLQFDLLVSNPGRHPLMFTAPTGWADAGTEMTVKGIRTDIPLARLHNSHAPSLAVGPAHLGPGAPDFPDSNELLAPGKSLRIPIRLRLAWEPGPYDLQVEFEADLLDSQGATLTRYEWVSPKSELIVKPRQPQ
jgi:hypothetical protein